jgi:hypothetical protein
MGRLPESLHVDAYTPVRAWHAPVVPVALCPSLLSLLVLASACSQGLGALSSDHGSRQGLPLASEPNGRFGFSRPPYVADL